MNKITIKKAFITSLPVMAGYIVLGFGFGILLYDKGYSFLWAILMSLTIYAGSMQYVGVNLLASGAGLIATAIMTLMVNARHLFYGISMVDEYRDSGKLKPYLIFALTDETYSLVCGHPDLPEGCNRNYFYFLVSIMNQFYWVLGSFLGSFAGSTLHLNTKGIDFSMTALFVIIFVEQWEKNHNHIPAMIGLVISILCLLVFGRANFLIPTMIGITIVLFIFRKQLEKKEEN